MINYKWWPRPAPYVEIWHAMQAYTEQRTAHTPDELWLVEHAAVYTLGQAGKPEHILDSGTIPVIHCDRGGQVTYHGPGQVVLYCLIDLRRLGLFVKEYVAMLEGVALQLLADLGITGACRKPGSPGIYVPMHGPAGADQGLAKIAALGIKVRKGCAYHGIALNVNMDLAPFAGINPCGYEGLRTIDLNTCGVQSSVHEVGELLAAGLARAIDQHDLANRANHADEISASGQAG